MPQEQNHKKKLIKADGVKKKINKRRINNFKMILFTSKTKFSNIKN